MSLNVIYVFILFLGVLIITYLVFLPLLMA